MLTIKRHHTFSLVTPDTWCQGPEALEMSQTRPHPPEAPSCGRQVFMGQAR